MTLEAGKQYQLRASGSFYMGVPEDGMADAEYGDFSSPKDHSVSTGVDYGVAVNGSKVHWGAYAEDHVYTIEFTGTGAPLSFSYQDDYYGDNSGWIVATEPPTAPTNLHATDVRASKVTLDWTDNFGDELWFVVEQAGDGDDFHTVGYVGANVTTYTATGLKPSTAYQFRVAAYNEVGNSDYSNVVDVTTKDVDEGTVPPNDDSYSEQLYFGFEVNFLGMRYDQLYVNNNGNLTFEGPLSTYSPSSDLTTGYGPIIAPFFADVDTRDDGVGTVSYAPLTVNDHKAYKVSWNSVGYYDRHYDKRNTFSVTLIERRDVHPGDFDIEFDYGGITWDTGDASGGLNGVADPQLDPEYVYPARVGWSNGTGQDGKYVELGGSGQPGNFLGGGPGHQHWEIRNPWTDVVAHRTGGKLGEEVSEDIEDANDPTQYLILTNNDLEEAEPAPDDPDRVDYDDEHASIPTGSASGDEDDDLAQMTLSAHFPAGYGGSSSPTGTVEIVPSYASSVRLFRSDGTELTSDQWSVDLADPMGYLAPLASGATVDVWVEGLQVNPDFMFSVVYRDEEGNEIARDDVHMTIAQWDFVRQDDEVNAPVTLTGLGSLLDAIDDPDATTPVAGAMAFKSRFQGLSDDLIDELRVFDPANTDDYFVDTISGAESELWAAAYLAGYEGRVLTASEREALRDKFDLNAVDPPGQAGPTCQVNTAQDVQERKVKTKLPTWSLKNDAATWALPDGSKPSYEQDFRKWLQGQFGTNAGLANLRDELWKRVASKDHPTWPVCSELEQWPLLYFAGTYALPVRWVNDKGLSWSNHTLQQDKWVSTIDYRAKTADTILAELNRGNLRPFFPQNLLNWRFDTTTQNDVPLSAHYTDDAWTVSADQAAIQWTNQNPTAKQVTARGSQDVGKIQVGDTVVTAMLEGWPTDPDMENQGHAEFITDIKEPTLTNGVPTLDTEVFLMFNSTADKANSGEWKKIRDLIRPGSHDNNNGHQYLIRSLDFNSFNQLWPA